MKKMVLGLMVVAGLLGTSTVVANAADTDSTGDVTFSSGTLSLSVTDNTNLSFGSNTISTTDATLNASTTPTVEVSDLRGTNAGWSLTVAQGQQFNTATDASGSALTNAALTVASTKVSSDSTVNTGNATLTPAAPLAVRPLMALQARLLQLQMVMVTGSRRLRSAVLPLLFRVQLLSSLKPTRQR